MINEPNTEAYRQFKAKRERWVEWSEGKDRHSIVNQVYSMIWDAAAYRMINTARGFAEMAEDGKPKLNGMTHVLINKCFFQSQANAIRRLLDKGKDTREKSVVSLYRLIQEMAENAELLSREHILAAEGLVYHYEAEREAWLVQQIEKETDDGQGEIISGFSDWSRAKERQEDIDSLCDVDKNSRRRDDTVSEELLARLKDWLLDAGAEVTTFVDKFIAHAATPESRGCVDADGLSITLGHLWKAHEVICRIASFVSLRILGGSVSRFLPMPQFDQLKHIDRPFAKTEDVGRLREAWRMYDEETQTWGETELEHIPETEEIGDFNAKVTRQQLAWRRKRIRDKRSGKQGDKTRRWILPEELWEEGLWPGIRSGSDCSLPDYLKRTGVQKHDGVHNLKSSWTLCANLYFPFSQDLPMLAGFLGERVCERVKIVDRLELEYAEKPPFDPQTLLGEREGKRGANQTSPDIAFLVRLADGGSGLILTENKYVEHSFYPCSGRKKQYANPDPKRCLDFGKLGADPPSQCWMCQWEAPGRPNRKYWDYLKVSERARQLLRWCPASTAGYQLFRQQALAEGIAQKGPYDLVMSCVAFDARNDTLIGSMERCGIRDFTKDWAGIFEGKASFATWTHQQWVEWVRQHDTAGRWRNWLEYVGARYDF